MKLNSMWNRRLQNWLRGDSRPQGRARVRGITLAAAWVAISAGIFYQQHEKASVEKPNTRAIARAAKQRATAEASKAVVPPRQRVELVREVVKKGDDFFRSQNFVAAQHHYQQALQLGEQKPNQQPVSSERPKELAALGESTATARYRLGFAYARQKQYERAIAAFRDCVSKYDGTSARNDLTYASLPEKAQYQIACCYRGLSRQSADGDAKAESLQRAIEEFTWLINRFPESPMAHQAARAIADLNGGKLPKSAGAAYGHAIRLEEKKRKEERVRMARCGPQALLWLLTNLPHRSVEHAPHLDQLAKECQTGEHGTSIYNLVQTAKKYGLTLNAFAATKQGLESLPAALPLAVPNSQSSALSSQSLTPPAILLWSNHFYIFVARGSDAVKLINPTRVTQSEDSRLAKSTGPQTNPPAREETITFTQLFSAKEVVHVILVEPTTARDNSESDGTPKEVAR